MTHRLAVIGAGAKAAALVARAAALVQANVPNAPEIIVYEADHVASAWTGQGKYSSGHLTLCTPGEKDVGFPYIEFMARPPAQLPIGPLLFGRFSYSAFLVSNGAISEWVDRGRDHPTHQRWAEYLKWVFAQAETEVVQARVESIGWERDKWKTSFRDKAGRFKQGKFDGVVLTGTGHARTIPIKGNVPLERILDAGTFWKFRTSLLKHAKPVIVIAGDGGAAGAVVAWLAGKLSESNAQIHCVTPMGTLFPRGDGYSERRWFSDPSDWTELSVGHRRKLIDRTEAGVISLRNKTEIDKCQFLQHLPGKVISAAWNGTELEIDVAYGARTRKSLRADFLVSAIGFDSWSLLECVDHPAAKSLIDPANGALRRKVESAMPSDLAMPTISNLPPGLHVPALAALAQGPGMANLGALGLMAERILSRHL